MSTKPLALFTCATGVSGSGKSTLVNEILYKSLKEKLYKHRNLPRDFDKILGTEQIEKVINIDQSPIGRTPRSNPATYINVFNDIREVFSMTPDRECADISRADSALMSAAANVKPAKVMV